MTQDNGANPAAVALPEPPYAFGGPAGSARLRATPEDFQVDEVLGFEPDGSGEHALLLIEKRRANTGWVAAQLGNFAGVGQRAVSFSGRKDRHAVTRQWFSIHLPGKPDPDWSQLAVEGVTLLRFERHSRKLRRGTHVANRFRLVLRDLAAGAGETGEFEQRLEAIKTRGIPAYFGSQRYGRGGANLASARVAFAKGRLPRDRERRGFLISAARSALFDAVLGERVADGSWDSLLAGDVAMLDGSHSHFVVEQVTEDLVQRTAALDIHPTGPLWGRGTLQSSGAAEALETRLAALHKDLAQGLESAGLKAERRSLRVRVADLSWHRDATSLSIEFLLPPGAYATSVVREIARCTEGPAPTAGAAPPA